MKLNYFINCNEMGQRIKIIIIKNKIITKNRISMDDKTSIRFNAKYVVGNL